MTAGPTSMLHATALPASSTEIIKTEHLLTSVRRRESHLMKMAVSKPEWVPRSATTMAMAARTFSKLTSPMTDHLYTGTTEMAHFPPESSKPAWGSTHNIWVGEPCFWTSTMMAGWTFSL